MFPTSILQGTYKTTDISDPYNGLTPFYVQDNGSGSVLRQTISGPYRYCIPEYGMTIELYHDGSGDLPTVGDKVYTYPDPQSYLRGRLKTQQQMLKPLGMWEVRSRRIRKMTEQYLNWNKKEASDLHGIGKYGSDSYQIFFFNNVPPNVQDKELRKYIDKLVG